MPIDPKGITPGLAKIEKKPTLVSIRCSQCSSMEFEDLKVQGSESQGLRVYRCTQCGFTKSVAVGGPVTF